MIRTPGADRIQTPHERPEEDADASLRPRTLEDFVGQDAVKEQLGVSLAAASARGEALDHVLLAGPPGLGKTSLAHIVAAQLDVPFVQTSGPALERKADIAAFLTALEPRAVFFVDEIHRLPKSGGGDVLSRDGGPPVAHHGRCGSGRARGHARPAGVHADRRDDPRGPPDHAAARPVRDPAPARPLRRRRPRPHRHALRARARRADRRRRERARSPSAPAAPRASPTACCGACATSRKVHGGGGDQRLRWPGPRSTCSRSTLEGLDRLDRAILSVICVQFSGRPGRPVDARRRRSRRSPTRSRMCTSRTCSSEASSSARHAGAARRCTRSGTWGSSPQRPTRRCSDPAFTRAGLR